MERQVWLLIFCLKSNKQIYRLACKLAEIIIWDLNLLLIILCTYLYDKWWECIFQI